MISNKTLFCSLLFLGLWLLTGCSSNGLLDPIDIGSSQAQPLKAPTADYRSVAWLNDDTIAFVYRQENFGSRLGDFRIGIFSISNESLTDVQRPPAPDDCPHASTVIGELNRLPDGRLGYIYSCSGQQGNFALLYAWEKETNTNEMLKYYPPPFGADSYTFAPGMSELIQENGKGNGMNNELYRVRIGDNEEMEQILTSYQRVGEPSWSSNGESIAFIGTEVYPEKLNDPNTWEQIQDLLRFPWDLYLMNADGSNVRIIILEAGRPYQLKWSPTDDNLLAFAGDLQDSQGIWLLDLGSQELARVWPHNTYFDWSPDGGKMVIKSQEKTLSRQSHLVVINIPTFEQ